MEKEAGLDQREKELLKQTDLVNEREQKLVAREEEVTKMMKSLQEKEKALLEAEKELNEKKEQIIERTKELDNRFEALMEEEVNPDKILASVPQEFREALEKTEIPQLEDKEFPPMTDDEDEEQPLPEKEIISDIPIDEGNPAADIQIAIDKWFQETVTSGDGELSFVEQYDRYYCYQNSQYLPTEISEQIKAGLALDWEIRLKQISGSEGQVSENQVSIAC